MFGNAVIPTAILLPLIGVLLVTGEFSQRTALTTFTLVPSRARVMIAKLSASVVCSVVALVFCLVVAAGATALHPATDPGVNAWSLHAVLIPQALLYLATAMITGVAFGAALLVSAPAIVIYLLLPTVWSVLTNSISGLQRGRQLARGRADARPADPARAERHRLAAGGRDAGGVDGRAAGDRVVARDAPRRRLTLPAGSGPMFRAGPGVAEPPPGPGAILLQNQKSRLRAAFIGRDASG